MTALESDSNFRLLTIRNLLLAVTLVLILIVGGMASIQFVTASEAEDKAKRAMTLNTLIDDIVSLKLAVSGERSYTVTAYGLPGAAPNSLSKLASTEAL